MGRRAIIALAIVTGCCNLAAPGEAAKKKRDPVLATLSAIAAAGGPQAAQVPAWKQLYSQGRSAARHLRGSAQQNVRGVLANLGSLARRRLLRYDAAPAFLVLRRNVEWFWEDRRGPAAYGARTTFPGSQLIYQFYPGFGWQLQPLANFGRLNGLLKLRRPRVGQLESFADELLGTGVTRRGFLAFEYYFPWSGGPPGWVSGMATATGMQALSGLWKRDGDSRYLDAARSMAGVFSVGPPWGVLVNRPEGPFFLQYSQDPSLLVGNSYAQAILGLDSYATASGDSSAAALVARALAAAREILPQYDTGTWSLYYRTPKSPGRESDLSYHELFGTFLDQMCERWQAPFCEEAANFHRYETEPVALSALRARSDKRHRRLRVGFSMSKRAGVSLKLVRGTRAVYSYVAQLFGGDHVIAWPLPKRGSYEIELSVKSLNGLTSETSRTVLVSR